MRPNQRTSPLSPLRLSWFHSAAKTTDSTASHPNRKISGLLKVWVRPESSWIFWLSGADARKSRQLISRHTITSRVSGPQNSSEIIYRVRCPFSKLLITRVCFRFLRWGLTFRIFPSLTKLPLYPGSPLINSLALLHFDEDEQKANRRNP